MIRPIFSLAAICSLCCKVPVTDAYLASSTSTSSRTVSRPTGKSSSGITTTLSMSLGDRSARIAKANINSFLKSLEEPEKIINQAVTDMSKDLAKIRASYAEVTVTQRKLMKQRENSEAEAAKWFNKASLALKYGKEDLAREALARRQQLLDTADSLQEQIDMQAASIDKLYDGMQALDGKISEARGKKAQVIARAKRARLQKEVSDMQNEKISGALGSLDGTSSALAAFLRMEDKIEALEAAAEASAEISRMGEMNSIEKVDLELEFKALEKSATVDAELAKLKGLLSRVEENPGTYIVTGSSGRSART